MIVELFAGTCSFSNVAKQRGMSVFTTDISDDFGVDLVKDILEVKPSDLPRNIDVLWASPPCEGFSVASIGKHWNIDNTPKSEKAVHSLKLVNKTLELINTLKPKYWVIENPRGKLRKLPIMEGLNRHTVTYCQYGDSRMKPTDIWTNIPNWQPRPMCKNGDSCHVSAPRGSRTGTQGIKTYKDRSRVPKELCKEILSCLS
jgi:site-specific DNA-cytosine methylase